MKIKTALKQSIAGAWIAAVLFCLLCVVVAVRFRRGNASYLDWMDRETGSG